MYNYSTCIVHVLTTALMVKAEAKIRNLQLFFSNLISESQLNKYFKDILKFDHSNIIVKL